MVEVERSVVMPPPHPTPPNSTPRSSKHHQSLPRMTRDLQILSIRSCIVSNIRNLKVDSHQGA